MTTKFIDTTKPQLEIKEKKETKFTHVLSVERGWQTATLTPNDFYIIKYLGQCSIDGDMFATHTESGSIGIHKGIKGDEFESC
jgi:hypothetical protein